MSKRNKRVDLRLTENELETLKQVAEFHGVTVTEYLVRVSKIRTLNPQVMVKQTFYGGKLMWKQEYKES